MTFCNSRVLLYNSMWIIYTVWLSVIHECYNSMWIIYTVWLSVIHECYYIILCE